MRSLDRSDYHNTMFFSSMTELAQTKKLLIVFDIQDMLVEMGLFDLPLLMKRRDFIFSM